MNIYVHTLEPEKKFEFEGKIQTGDDLAKTFEARLRSANQKLVNSLAKYAVAKTDDARLSVNVALQLFLMTEREAVEFGLETIFTPDA